MKWKKTIGFAVAALAAGLMACGLAAEDGPVPEAVGQSVQNIGGKMRPVIPDSEADFDKWRSFMDRIALSDAYVKEVQDFSWSSASELLKGRSANENYSPVGLYFALSLSALGAEGETEEELLKVLGISGDKFELAKQCEKLYLNLYQPERVSSDGNKSRTEIANSLWLTKDREFQAEFLRHAMKFYAEAFSAVFSHPDTGKYMGRWVKESTEGLIAPEFPVSEEQVFSIINTIYFYDEWTDRFDPAKTEPGVFYLEDGREKEAEFMKRKAMNGFSKGENFTRAQLPLKECGNMVFVLPDEGHSVEELLADKETLSQAFCGGAGTYGNIIWEVPKFSFGQSYDLKNMIKRLGVENALEAGADFSFMTGDGDVWIDTIRQETHMGIDENGVEAAAFTEIAYAGAGIPKEQADMILNRPFLYAIMSRQQIPLFVGVYRGTEDDAGKE